MRALLLALALLAPHAFAQPSEQVVTVRALDACVPEQASPCWDTPLVNLSDGGRVRIHFVHDGENVHGLSARLPNGSEVESDGRIGPAPAEFNVTFELGEEPVAFYCPVHPNTMYGTVRVVPAAPAAPDDQPAPDDAPPTPSTPAPLLAGSLAAALLAALLWRRR